MGDVTFRPVEEGDGPLLDEMTLAGARFWGHHENHPEAYRGLEAAIATMETREGRLAFVLEADGSVVGFYELWDRGDHIELMRMFLATDRIGRGYGRLLWNHATGEASRSHERMFVRSDPGAIGFYAAMGATLEGHHEVTPGFSLGLFWMDLRQS